VCTVSGNTTILDLKRDNTFEQDGLQVSRVSSQETPSDIDNVSQITVQLPSPFASLPACHSSAN